MGIVLLVIFTIGCGLVWVSLFWRDRTQDDLAEEQSIPGDDQPDIPDDALIHRFRNGWKSAAIYVDRSGQMVHFYNCHAPRRFLSLARGWISCPVDEILAVHVYRGRRTRSESLTVVTANGKVMCFDSDASYKPLRDTLIQLAPDVGPEFAKDHPLTHLVWGFGAASGLFAGAYQTPIHARDWTLDWYILGGMFLGAAGAYVFTWSFNRISSSIRR